MGLTALLHQRSMIFHDYDGDGWGLSFPDIRLAVEGNPGKLTRPVIEPGPLGERQYNSLSTTAMVIGFIHSIKWDI